MGFPMTCWPQDDNLLPLVEEQLLATDALRQSGKKMPAPGSIDIEKMRQAKRSRASSASLSKAVPAIANQQFKSSIGNFQTRTFSATPSNGLYLHFHGGGWALGSIDEQDELLSDLVRSTKLTAISIDYPLAPEHTLDVILSSAQAALVALLAEFPDVPVVVGGESAGAHIAVNTVLGLRQYPPLLARVRALSLSYGLYDLSMTPSQRTFGQQFAGLSTPYLEWFYSMALPGRSPEERRDPKFSPLYQNLEELPPAIFSVGTCDPLLDDTLFMASRWASAGNTAVLRVYPEAAHGFNGLPTGMARAANGQIYDFIGESLKSERA